MSRLTPDSALRTVGSEAQNLARLLEQSSTQLASNPGQSLARDLRQLLARELPGPPRIDVARPAVLDDATCAAIAAVLGPGVDPSQLEPADRPSKAEPERTLRVFRFDNPPPTPVGRLVPPYLVLVLPPDWASSVGPDELDDLVRDRARVLLLPLDGFPSDDVRELGRRLQKHAWLVEARAPGAPTERPWLEELATPEWEPPHLTAEAFALATACDQANRAFELVLRKEAESLRVRKAQLEQRMQVSRGEAPSVRIEDVAREAEAYSRQQFTEFDRGVTDSMASWTAPQTGALGIELNRTIAELDELGAEELTSSAVLKVPREFEQHLLGLLRTRLLERARRDLLALADLQALLSERVSSRLRDARAPDVPLTFGLPATSRFERMLDNRLVIENPYRSEARARGAYEYLMAARRYAMVFGVMAGMFLPLLGVLAPSGPSDGEGLSAAEMLRIGMSVIGIGLMVFGIMQVRRRVPRERAENLVRELERARESMRREVRRMVTEAEREWLQIVRDHLRDQPAALRSELELKLETHLRQQGESQEEQQTRIQRQMRSLEDTARLHTDAERQRGELVRRFEQMRGGLKQLFGDLLRDARRSAPATAR